MKTTLRLIIAVFVLAAFDLSAASVIQFSAATYNVTEGLPEVTIFVQRTNDLDTVVSVDFATVTNVTATAGLDFLEVATNITFLANETNKTVVVPILNDGVVEGLETFQVVLTNASGGAVLGVRSTATVSITDNDIRIQLSSSTYTVSEEAGTVEVGVVRGDDGDYPVTVDFATTDLSAIAGVDYEGVTNTLRFAAGEKLKAVSIAISNDTVREQSKAFRVAISNPTGGAQLGSPVQATVTITDTTDEVVQLEFANYWAAEDTGFVRIGITRGESSTGSTVDFQNSDVTATAGLDYTGLTNTLTFAPGERLKLIDITILNDGLKETNETFGLTLINPTGGAVLGTPRVATVTILDNDPGVQFDYNKYWVSENAGAVAVQVQRGNDVDLTPFTVDFATVNITAVAGVDYEATNGTLAFAEGELFKLVSVPILWNLASQADNQFKLTLSNPSPGVALGKNVSTTNVVLDTTGMEPHGFAGIAVPSDSSVQLTLQGGVHNRFKDYFDLYPVEVSTNLTDWIPLVTLQRTNSSTNVLVYTESGTATYSQRFYRMVTNHLITPMLSPTGPWPVGMVNRCLTDPTRRNRFQISTNGSFMVQIWYPAKPEAGKLPVSYEDQMRLRDPEWLDTFFDREPYFVSHAVLDAECASDVGPCPIVLLSHGLGAYRYQMAEKAENLASHGYIFVGVDHFDAARPALPDGTLGNVATPSTTSAGLQDRVRDLSFVLDQLAIWNSFDPVFAGRLDLGRVGVMGFSWGGYTAAEFCRVDARCQIAIPLDPGGDRGSLMATGLQKPFLQINNGSNSDTSLYAKATRNAIWFQISGTEHGHFDDFYWFSYASTLGAAREVVCIVNDYSLWFLNKHLKGSTDPMPAPKDHPRVINFKQK